jgi:hypothetical protein
MGNAPSSSGGAEQAPAPNCQPYGGGRSVNSASSSTTVVGTPIGGGGNTETSGQSEQSCPNTILTDQTQINRTQNLNNIDNSVIMINKSNIKSISTSINQMVVNSITNTTSSSSQNVNIAQKLSINIEGVAKDVTVSNISQTATIDLSNAISTEMSAIDNVRTDLSNQIMQQFSNNISSDVMSKASNDIQNEIANQTAAAVKQKNDLKSETKKETLLFPGATPYPPPPANANANIITKQKTVNDLLVSTTISAPFSLTNDVSKTIETNIQNSVTQNFTRNTVTQLMQAINLSQDMSIKIKSVGGNVTVSNISQLANIQLRQVLDQKMNIGTAITNSMSASAGIQNDESVTLKKRDESSNINRNDLRNTADSTSDQDQKSSSSLTMTTGFGGSTASCGSSFFIFCSCCICIVLCMVGPMLGGMIPASGDSEASEEETSEESTSSDAPASEASATEAPAGAEAASSDAPETSVGGYY